MAEQRVQNFTEGPILGPLIRFQLPILGALFLQAFYGAVDLLIVGQFGTAADISAVSTGSQLMQLIQNTITSMAMGTTILLGRHIGERKTEKSGQDIGAAIWEFGIVGIVLTVLILALTGPIARLLQAPKEAMGGTTDYIFVCGAGTLFIVAYNVLSAIFRGLGDSRTPLLIVGMAAIFNVGGDLALVAGLKMGPKGAALATVLAQALSVIIALLIVRRRELPFRFQGADLNPKSGSLWKTMKQEVRYGTPIALQDLLVGLSFLVILGIVNTLGVVPSAGVGVAEKICAFIMLIPSSAMQALSAIVAQNAGAGKTRRARKAMGIMMLFAFVLDVIIAYFAFFHGQGLARIFSSDLRVTAAAADYLKAYAIDCLLVPFLFSFIGYFNGWGKTGFTMAQGIIGAFGVRIPVSYYMSRAASVSLFHIGLATPCSSVVQIVLCLGYFWYLQRRLRGSSRG